MPELSPHANRGEFKYAVRTGKQVFGAHSTLPRQQFQLLYREVGYALAKEISEEFIIWPCDRDGVPYAHDDVTLKQWALMEDADTANIPEAVERAFKRRWENYAKAEALALIRGAVSAHRQISTTTQTFFKQLNTEKSVDEDKLRALKELSPMAAHMHNAAAYTYAQFVGTPKQAPNTAIQINNRLTLDAGARPSVLAQGVKAPAQKDLRMLDGRTKEARAIKKAIPAEYRELPAPKQRQPAR